MEWPPLFGISFDATMDVAAFLTFLALLAGFIAWIIKTVKELRRASQDRAKSGALRLLLKILREYRGRPVSIAKLREEFGRPDRRPERKAYCDRDFKFKNDPEFEAAVYQLQWEFKIDFTDNDEVFFRTHEHEGMAPLQINPDVLLEVLTAELASSDSADFSYETKPLVELGMRITPDKTLKILDEALNSANSLPQRRKVLRFISTLH